MRLLPLLSLGFSALLLVGGGILLCEAEGLVHTPQVQRLGQKLGWSGSWWCGLKAGGFQPDFERWHSNFMTLGWVLVSAGAGSCAMSFWRFAKKAPRFTLGAERGPLMPPSDGLASWRVPSAHSFQTSKKQPGA